MARILFISHTSVPGGPTNSLLSLLKYVRRQHEVAVAAPGDGGLFADLKEMGVPGYRAGSRGLTWRSIPWLYRLIVRGEFDLVYGNNYGSGPRNALIAAKLTGRRFVWHIREVLREGVRPRTAFFLRYADVLIAVSQASARSVRDQIPARNIHVVYNGIELEEFQPGIARARQHVRSILGIPPDHLVIANVGVVSARKGQAYAVKAATEILSDYPTVAFAFLGSLDLEPEYVHTLRAQAAQMEGKIRLLGFRSDVPLFLVGSDILLHTAAWDPNPRAVLEGMAAGLPVVAFAVDGVREQVINGETGYLVPFGDVRAMIKALKECLDNPSLRRRMGEMGRRRVETMFTAGETARQISAIINDVLAEGT